MQDSTVSALRDYVVVSVAYISDGFHAFFHHASTSRALARLANAVHGSHLDTVPSKLLLQIMRIPHVKTAFWTLAIIETALESIMDPTLAKIVTYAMALHTLCSMLGMLFSLLLAIHNTFKAILLCTLRLCLGIYYAILATFMLALNIPFKILGYLLGH